jgi:uncharacterized damage-inducible protein DinB
MSFPADTEYLLDYTEWDRARWESWFRAQGADAFAVDVGANADVRFGTVGELVRHIFSAEQRYVERIQELPLTDTSAVPANDADALFTFGRATRQRLRDLMRDFPTDRWDRGIEIQMGTNKRIVTPKTMVVQSVTHEIRHWAQIAAFLRVAGRKTGSHDFLVSGIFERALT